MAQKKQKKKQINSMPVVNPHAAGIDVGARTHYVAVGQQAGDVRSFGCYTADMHQVARWLQQHQITTVAMESTGSYWKGLFQHLQSCGFEVLLVQGKHTKNVKGRKTDVLDCQWIQRLHSLGLLSGSFLPDDATAILRQYVRQRSHLTDQGAIYIKKMQQALRQMNIRLDVAISDITGKSGRAIVEAILAGERNPEALAALADWRVKKSKEEITL
jgi:transposase